VEGVLTFPATSGTDGTDGLTVLTVLTGIVITQSDRKPVKYIIYNTLSVIKGGSRGVIRPTSAVSKKTVSTVSAGRGKVPETSVPAAKTHPWDTK